MRRLGVEAVGLFATDGTGTSGSNGWLVSGARTVTGHAVIGGDPHRFIEDPGVYQQIHLACPEFDVVGLAVPGVPGIAHFAHTGHVAWAITNAMADYQDLYRERLRVVGSSSSVEALGADGEWRVAARHVERVEVAGGESVEVEVIETERGPVVIGGTGEDEVISLRYPPRVSEDLGFSALLPLLRAREVGDVDRAFDLWAEPVNVVQAADTAGGLLHRVAGRVPVRSEGNRTRVVDAWEEGREWRGWHAMPRVGVSGIAVMANQRGLAEELGVEFAAPHRAARIRELLVSRAEWAASDMAAIHVDTHLASAAVLLGHLDGGGGQRLSPEGVRCGINCSPGIGGWMPAAFPRGFTRRFVALLCGGLRRSRLLAVLAEPPAYPEVFLPWLALTPRIGFALENLLGVEELYGIDRTALVCAAVEDVAAAGWTPRAWGDTHRLAPWRALAGSAYDEPGLSGDHDCVLCTSAVPGVTDLAARGPAARYVWDLADRDQSLWVVPLGADGVPGAAHHRDQLPLWVEGVLAPVITDWDKLAQGNKENHDH